MQSQKCTHTLTKPALFRIIKILFRIIKMKTMYEYNLYLESAYKAKLEYKFSTIWNNGNDFY